MTLIERIRRRKRARIKVQRLIIRGKNRALLTLRKRGTHQGWKGILWEWEMGMSRRKRGTHQILIGVFIRSAKGHLWKRDRFRIRKEKGAHIIAKRVIIRGKKRGTDHTRKEALMIKGNVHLLKEKGHRSDFIRGTYRRWKGAFYKRGK